MTEFELGYTPANLRRIVETLNKQGMTSKDIALALGASKYTTLYNWMIEDLENPQSRNMPQDKWRKIVDLYRLNT